MRKDNAVYEQDASKRTPLDTKKALKRIDELQGELDELRGQITSVDTTLTNQISSVNSNLLKIGTYSPSALFSTTYGTDDIPLNINSINNATGYAIRCYAGNGLSGNLPTAIIGGNSFILIGFSTIKNEKIIYGVQIAIGFGSSKIAIRNAPHNANGSAWNAWSAV